MLINLNKLEEVVFDVVFSLLFLMLQGCKLLSDIGQCPTKFGKCPSKSNFDRTFGQITKKFAPFSFFLL